VSRISKLAVAGKGVDEADIPGVFVTEEDEDEMVLLEALMMVEEEQQGQ
jgi:hypothetical protein